MYDTLGYISVCSYRCSPKGVQLKKKPRSGPPVLTYLLEFFFFLSTASDSCTASKRLLSFNNFTGPATPSAAFFFKRRFIFLAWLAWVSFARSLSEPCDVVAVHCQSLCARTLVGFWGRGILLLLVLALLGVDGTLVEILAGAQCLRQRKGGVR